MLHAGAVGTVAQRTKAAKPCHNSAVMFGGKGGGCCLPRQAEARRGSGGGGRGGGGGGGEGDGGGEGGGSELQGRSNGASVDSPGESQARLSGNGRLQRSASSVSERWSGKWVRRRVDAAAWKTANLAAEG